MGSKKVRLLAVEIFVFAFIILLAQTVTAQTAEELLLEVKKADTSGFPAVKLVIQMPVDTRFTNKAFRESDFEILENGVVLSGFQAEPLNPKTERGATILLVDTSGSMAGQPLEDAKAALKAFISMAKPNEMIAINTFNDKINKLSDFRSDHADLPDLIDQIEAKGSTGLFDSIIASAQTLKETSAVQKNIVIMSDGKDTVSKASTEEAKKAIYSSGAFVSTVALTSKQYDPEFLKAIANDTGGSFMETTDSATLMNLYTKLAAQIYNQYSVSIKSINPQTQMLEYEVKVKASNAAASGKKGIINPGYNQPTSGKTGSSYSQVKPLKVIKDRWQGPVNSKQDKGTALVILILSLFLVFAAIGLIVWVLFGFVFRTPTTLRKQSEFLNKRLLIGRTSKKVEDPSDKKISTGILEATDNIAKRRGYSEMIGDMLERADIPMRVPEFIVLHLAGILFMGSFVALTLHNLLLDIFVILVSALGPLAYIQHIINGKLKVFEEYLPDTLRVMTSSLRSGYSFSQAIDVVAREDIPEVSKEFHKVTVESRLGLALEQALENLAKRINSESVDWMVLAVRVQREVGGNLAEILDILANTIQERDAVKRQIQTLTAEGRISAIVLVALPFFLMFILLIVNPGYLTPLFTTIPGIIMTIGTSIMMVVGIIWMRNIVRIEV